MFRRLHLQMTFFSTLITSLILLSMTAACLFLVEKENRERNYDYFTGNLSSILTYFEDQNTVSLSWLLQMEQTYQLKINILDNGASLFSSKLIKESPTLVKDYALARETAKESYGFSSANSSPNPVLTRQAVFPLKGVENDRYYACTALIPKGKGYLDVVLLYSLTSLEKSVNRQRLLFALADLFAIILLALFSWFFTGWMIKPLRDSRLRQARFIQEASHELRSPLAVILQSLSAMEKAQKEEKAVFAENIRSEGQRMSRLIQEMLSLASADSQSWEIHPREVELDTLVLNIYEKYEILAREKNLDLSVDLPEEDCPSCSVDGERLSQVLSILMDNALSYLSPPGKISLRLSYSGSSHEISVCDNGVGIPDEDKKMIFERFYRLDASHQDKSHFGLGLCIAQEIVRLHRGKLWVEDTPGGGATFVISLPR